MSLLNLDDEPPDLTLAEKEQLLIAQGKHQTVFFGRSIGLIVSVITLIIGVALMRYFGLLAGAGFAAAIFLILAVFKKNQ